MEATHRRTLREEVRIGVLQLLRDTLKDETLRVDVDTFMCLSFGDRGQEVILIHEPMGGPETGKSQRVERKMCVEA